MIENINQNTKQTNSTLKMDGMAYIRALTTIRIPCHRDIARSGRSARNVRNERNTFKFSFSSISNENTDTCVFIKQKKNAHKMLPLIDIFLEFRYI